MRERIAVYALLGCLVSAVQFGFFDCSGVKVLSFGAGALTVFVALVAIDRVYVMSVSPRSAVTRLALGTAIATMGAGATFALGWFTMITHMCG